MPHYASVEDVLRLHAGTFDVVYLHRVATADRYLPLVRQHCPRARVIYSVADLHHVRLARQAQMEQRPELLAHSRNVAAIEIMAARRADLVLTHSPVEAALLAKSVGSGKVHMVPFAVASRAPCRAFADRQGMVFVGSFGHAPNRDAVNYLLRDVLPLVWARDPSITCQVVGHGWKAARLSGLDPRVTVLGPGGGFGQGIWDSPAERGAAAVWRGDQGQGAGQLRGWSAVRDEHGCCRGAAAGWCPTAIGRHECGGVGGLYPASACRRGV